MSRDPRSWLSSRKATNQLLAFAIVVLAAGFVSVGETGYDGLRIVADVFLALVFFGSIVLFLGYLLFVKP